MKNKKTIVLTGGPCCGKTTILERLASQGLTIIPETARIIIEEEQKKDSEYLPWRNLYAFQERVARVQREQEHSYHDKLLFLDRGIVDGHGFSLNGEIETPEIITELGKNRYKTVLLLDFLPNYRTDSARKESKEMARRIHDMIEQAYREFGYQVHRIPVIQSENLEQAITQRADYVTKLLERVL